MFWNDKRKPVSVLTDTATGQDVARDGTPVYPRGSASILNTPMPAMDPRPTAARRPMRRPLAPGA